MPKSELTESGIGAIHYGQIYTKYGAWTASTHSFVSNESAAKLAKANSGDIIITNTSENLDDVGKAVAWLGSDPIVTGGHATVIRHRFEPKFLSYWFQTEAFATQKRALATGTKVIDVSARQLGKVLVPVPPLEVQRDIVKVLDTFTELEAELEAKLQAELQARRREYAYFRNDLLGGKTVDSTWVPMGEVGVFTRGRRFTKADVDEDGIPSIHYGEIYTHYGVSAAHVVRKVREPLRPQLRFAMPGDVVIASVGETVEDVGKAVAWLGDEPVAIHDDTFGFRTSMNPKFVSYWMQTDAFHSQKTRYVASAKIKRLSSSALASIRIPTPPAEVQRRIVGTLDEFDALVNDLSIVLPAELAARRKQYEYYRDKLLTFEEAPA